MNETQLQGGNKDIQNIKEENEDTLNSTNHDQVDKKNEEKDRTEISLPEKISKIVNIQEEEINGCNQLKKLKNLAISKNIILLSFIAHGFGEKLSPYRTITTSIDEWDEVGVEYVLYEIENKINNLLNKPTGLYLLIDTPGGSVKSAYKIALLIRNKFEYIHVFVPRYASSGGTLIAFTGNKITLGDAGSLTPIVVQVPYSNIMVSTRAYTRALNEIVKYFEDKKIDGHEAPYPRRVMAEKIDLITYSEWNTVLKDMEFYTFRILSKSGYNSKEIDKIKKYFVFPEVSHTFVIDSILANFFGLHVDNSQEYLQVLEFMRHWLYKHLPTSGVEHIIRYITPNSINSTKL